MNKVAVMDLGLSIQKLKRDVSSLICNNKVRAQNGKVIS